MAEVGRLWKRAAKQSYWRATSATRYCSAMCCTSSELLWLKSVTLGPKPILLEALELAEQSGDVLIASRLHNNYAIVLIARDDLAGARRHLEAARVRTGSESAIGLDNLGWVMLQEGEPDGAAACFTDALRSARLRGRVGDIPYPVLGIACCATHRGASGAAAVLHGGADALLSQSSVTWEAFEATARDQNIAVLRERLGEDFDHLYAEGLTLPNDEIIGWRFQATTSRVEPCRNQSKRREVVAGDDRAGMRHRSACLRPPARDRPGRGGTSRRSPRRTAGCCTGR